MVGRWFFMIIGTIFSITPAFVYWLAGTLAANGDAVAPTAGDIVAFTTLQSRLFFPLGQLLNVQVEIQGALALFDRIFEYLEMDPEIVDAPDAVALDPQTVRGRVRFRDVSFRYPTRQAARDRASRRASDDGPAVPRRGRWREPPAGEAADAEELAAAGSGADAVSRATGIGASSGRATAVLRSDRDHRALPPRASRRSASRASTSSSSPGELVALVGPSGSGKTTTTYLIPRLYDVDEGAVEIDDLDVRQIALASLGEAIGFVTQETYLFHSSIRDNLTYARPEATQAELEAATRAAAIHDRIVELPEGYDTIVGERGYKLSGGEKQRIAIARVLLKDPRILILDEATSALDTVSERLIQAALERLMEGRTTVAIAHRLSTILRGRPDPRLRAGPDRRTRHARRAARRGRPVRAALPGAVPHRRPRPVEAPAGRLTGADPRRRPTADYDDGVTFTKRSRRSGRAACASARRRARGHEVRADDRESDTGAAADRARPGRRSSRAPRWTSSRSSTRSARTTTAYRVHATAEQREEYPQVFTRDRHRPRGRRARA